MSKSRPRNPFALIVIGIVLAFSLAPLAGASGGPAAASSVTATPTPTAPSSATEVALDAEPSKVNVRETVTLMGTVTSDEVACSSGAQIELRREPLGSSEPGKTTQVTTDEAGQFELAVRVEASADFTAVTRPVKDADCPETSSEAVTVLVRALVDIFARPSQPERGSKFAISGRVSPPHPGTRVKLKKRVKGVWRPAGRAMLDDSSRFSKTYRARWEKRIFRAVWPSADADHEAGKSKRVVVKTRKPREKPDR